MTRRFKQSKGYFGASCRWSTNVVLSSMALIGVATGCARFDANGDPSFADTSSMSSDVPDSTGNPTGDGDVSSEEDSDDIDPDGDLTHDESETTPSQDESTTGTENDSQSDDTSTNTLTNTFDTDSEDGSSTSSTTDDDSSSSESTTDSSDSTQDSDSSEDDGDNSDSDDSENSDEDESEDILKCAELPIISPKKWCSEEGEKIRVTITNACSDLEIIVVRMRPNCRLGERHELAPGESLELATHVGDWFVMASPDQTGILGAYQMQAEDADQNLMWPPVE